MNWTQNKKKKHAASFATACFSAATLLQACGDSGTPVSLTAYNHGRTHDIEYFTVNGPGGVGLRRGGRSGETCCIVIPNKWRPGLKTSVTWSYISPNDKESEVMPVITREVEFQKYSEPNAVQVHFYENDKVKIVVSRCSPEHPFYPLSLEDLLPWEPISSKSEYRRSAGPIDC
jgi:hypothetical protein